MVVEDGRPFSNFNSKAMQLMIKWAKQGVGDTSKTPINGAAVREEVQKEAELLRKELKKELHGKVLHVSADMAAKDGRSFIGNIFCLFVSCWGFQINIFILGLNAQFYDEVEGKLKLVNLATREVFESHSGDNIRKWIKETLESYGITDIQLLGLAIDSAANITKAVYDLVTEVDKKIRALVQRFVRDDEAQEKDSGDFSDEKEIESDADDDEEESLSDTEAEDDAELDDKADDSRALRGAQISIGHRRLPVQEEKIDRKSHPPRFTCHGQDQTLYSSPSSRWQGSWKA